MFSSKFLCYFMQCGDCAWLSRSHIWDPVLLTSFSCMHPALPPLHILQGHESSAFFQIQYLLPISGHAHHCHTYWLLHLPTIPIIPPCLHPTACCPPLGWHMGMDCMVQVGKVQPRPIPLKPAPIVGFICTCTAHPQVLSNTVGTHKFVQVQYVTIFSYWHDLCLFLSFFGFAFYFVPTVSYNVVTM